MQCLGDLRTELGFKIFADVLMPEHFHLLISAAPAAAPVLRLSLPATTPALMRHPSLTEAV